MAAKNTTPPGPDGTDQAETGSTETGSTGTGRTGAPASGFDPGAGTGHGCGSAAGPDAGRTAGGASGGASAGRTGPDTGFFGWMRSLGVPRQAGWIGGVASGVAARLGIDPVIVRGVLVVFALFAPPAFLVYGVAWLLLPDTTGRIHLEEATRGVFDRALAGIAVFIVVGFVAAGPAAGAFPASLWGAVYDDVPWADGGFSLFPVFWGLILLGAVVALVLWLVFRDRPAATANRASTPGYPHAAPAASDSPAAASDAATPNAAAPLAPPAPTTAEGTDEYAAWKEQHAAWRVEYDAWRAAQSEAGRQARSQLVAENKARAAQFVAQAEQARLVRRLTRPRTSFAFVVATFGAALVVGALAGIAALSAAVTSAFAWPVGLAAAALVVAVAMIVAGLSRRRSGFLAFTTVVLLVLSGGTLAVPRSDVFALGSWGGELYRSTSVFQPVGGIQLTASAVIAEAPAPPRLDVVQGAGWISLDLYDDARVNVSLECGECTLSVARIDSDGTITQLAPPVLREDDDRLRWSGSYGDGITPGRVDGTVRVRAASTNVSITIHESAEEAGR